MTQTASGAGEGSGLQRGQPSLTILLSMNITLAEGVNVEEVLTLHCVPQVGFFSLCGAS